MSHWRKQAALVIERVVQKNKGATEKELRAAISAAYPFGERAYHPYKIWCNQVKVTLWRMFPKPHRQPKQDPVEDLPLFGGKP